MAYGFGGLGSSFPMRTNTPDSQGVDFLGNQADWMSDWTGRKNALAASAQDATPDKWVDPSSTPGGYAAYKQLLNAPNAQIRMGTLTSGAPGGSLTQVLMKGQDAFVPDFTALNKEYIDKQAAYSNQTAQQQAYDGMQGNYQFNGMPTAAYSTPGFGQVTGQTDPYGLGNVPSGVNLPAQSGVSGAGQQTGVYNPGGANKAFWGL